MACRMVDEIFLIWIESVGNVLLTPKDFDLCRLSLYYELV